ncbi:unnamed protein product [Ectocarpus sp. 8 AP-2014]
MRGMAERADMIYETIFERLSRHACVERGDKQTPVVGSVVETMYRSLVYSRLPRERNQIRFLSLDLHVDADVGGFMRYGCNLMKCVCAIQAVHAPYSHYCNTIRCRPARFQIIR